MSWKKITSNIEFFKFTTEGDSLEGTWQGTQPPNKEGYAPTGKILLDDNPVVQGFSMSAVLRPLGDLPVGTKVKVVYLGRETGKSGQQYKNFDVFVDDPDQKEDDKSDAEVPF
jgi:hypothetical protein